MTEVPEFNPAGFEGGVNRYYLPDLFRVAEGDTQIDLNPAHDLWFDGVYNNANDRVAFWAIREFLDWEGEDLAQFAIEYNAAYARCKKQYRRQGNYRMKSAAKIASGNQLYAAALRKEHEQQLITIATDEANLDHYIAMLDPIDGCTPCPFHAEMSLWSDTQVETLRRVWFQRIFELCGLPPESEWQDVVNHFAALKAAPQPTAPGV